MAEGFSLKIPLRYNKEDGPYQLTKTLPETVKQNFINLIMTVPGERVMNPDFGVGVHQLLFENEKSEVVEIFKERLFDQTKKYLPFIKITNTEINLVEHTMNIIITYYISNLGISSALSLNIDKK
tara:strand:- start:172 stop:546 length:375 start_codon:yes stop_codon:yes gene_type:complete